MSIKEDDVKNDSDNDLGDDFDYQPNAEGDAEDDDVDSLDSTSKSEEVCGVKRIANLMVEDIWILEFRTEDEACQFYNAYSWALNIKLLSTTLDKVEFSVTALGDPAKDRRMEVDRGKNLFSCSCKLFESRDISCSHVFCAMKFENILEFPDLLIYKRWTKNAKNEFISTEMPVNDDIERVLKFRVGALASNCNKLCDIACKDLADFDEVQSELVNLVIRLQSRKQGKSTPNVNVEGINNPFVVKSKGAPSKRSSWRKKRACSN
ncbi:hypothetical protein HN873_030439 [Arachis hypogaea]